MKVEVIEGMSARCAAKGVAREVNLFMLQEEEVAVGDFVLVHIGYAIQKVTPHEALSAWEAYDAMLAADDA
jgi:hydrogenase expression/formation protein HypC